MLQSSRNKKISISLGIQEVTKINELLKTVCTSFSFDQAARLHYQLTVCDTEASHGNTRLFI